MLNFLSKLFQSPFTPPKTSTLREVEIAPADARSNARGDADSYYETMGKIQAAHSKRDYPAAALATRENMAVIPTWVSATAKDYGRFDISSIPAFKEGGAALAVVGDRQGLVDMARLTKALPELEPWIEMVEGHVRDLTAIDAVRAVLATTSGMLQTEINSAVPEEFTDRVGRAVLLLERSGEIARIKVGKMYKVVVAGAADFPAPPPKRAFSSHRTSDKLALIREIDISTLAYIPLPRSPLRWEETQARRERVEIAATADRFEVRDADWTVSSIDKIPMSERPDPAFRSLYVRASGLLLVDDLGKAAGFEGAPAAAICYDRAGNITAKAALIQDQFHLSVHPLGRGMIAMSAECVLHSYGDDLELILETPLSAAPEIKAIRKRFEISDDQLRSHIRCIAQTADADRYLFTAVDEAWCVGADGKSLWGAKLPLKEGWERVTQTSSGFGTRAEIQRALELMQLALPVTPETIKQRYRDLAKKCHPDLNPGDAHAPEKMKALNAAAEVLTGVDAAAMPRFAGASFYQELSRTELEAGGHRMTLTMGMSVSERYAADWIYAASFASDSGSAYLAGYSGRVVMVDDKGIGVRVYDIGAVPRRIVDTGQYLYLLTDTRLYVLRNEACHALIDIVDGGDLIVASNGFGLLEKKRLRWFSSDGQYLGSVLTKEPIRRVYRTTDNLVIETRQFRATVAGAPEWWRPDV